MKKFLTVILAMLYLGTSSGATIHLHYCMGKLIDMKLWHNDANKCSNCGMEKGPIWVKKCCKDEHKTLKLGNDQKAAENIIHSMQFTTIASTPSFIELPQVHITSLVEQYPLNHAPPRSHKVQLNILHCIFLI